MKLTKFYILMDIEKALRKWRTSGKRCTFGVYCQTLKALGYRLIMALFLLGIASGVANATEVNVSRLADSIYQAEGGSRTAHPYGIMAHYKKTSPRQACINTIKHRLKGFRATHRPDAPIDAFISYLGHSYAPIGALNDPRGLNANWVSNVTYIYKTGKGTK